MGFGKDGKGAIVRESVVITVGALAANTVLSQTAGGVKASMEDDFRIVKTTYNISGSGGDGDENLIVGIADGELSITEIKECLEANGPVDRNDRIQVEEATRPVFELGNYEIGDANASEARFTKTMERVLRWTFSNPEGWQWFVYNASAAAITTGLVLDITAKHFGVWVT